MLLPCPSGNDVVKLVAIKGHRDLDLGTILAGAGTCAGG